MDLGERPPCTGDGTIPQVRTDGRLPGSGMDCLVPLQHFARCLHHGAFPMFGRLVHSEAAFRTFNALWTGMEAFECSPGHGASVLRHQGIGERRELRKGAPAVAARLH